LAILAGHPDHARLLFEAIGEAPAEAPIGVVFDRFETPEAELQRYDVVGRYETIRKLGAAVEELQEGGTLLPSVGVLQGWLPVVSRYSFRLGARTLGRVP
jgi:hypothetical protein